MKKGVVQRMIVVAVAVIAVVCAIRWYAEYARREAFIAHCVDDGAGAMFSSRESCEELYDQTPGNR